MAQPLADWLLRADLSRDGYAYGEVSPEWFQDHTRCTVATGPAVGKGNQSGQKSLIFEDCKGTRNREITRISPKAFKLGYQVDLIKRRK